MLISEARKFICIAVPKTGRTAIESHLPTLDSNIQRNSFPRSDGTWVSVHKNARASEIKTIMGDRISEYTVIAIIRDPISTAISKYYYYRIGRGAQRARQWRVNVHLMKTRLRVLSAMILPLRTWVRLYPYGMTHEVLVDDKRNLLVDALGDFDNLQEEFDRIFVSFGFASEDLKLPSINKVRGQAPIVRMILCCGESSLERLHSTCRFSKTCCQPIWKVRWNSLLLDRINKKDLTVSQATQHSLVQVLR